MARMTKLRRITKTSTGDVMGITIRKDIADQFPNTYFKQRIQGDTIILESGAKT